MKQQTCKCGCGKTFPVNSLKKYAGTQCRKRVEYYKRKAAREPAGRICVRCGEKISLYQNSRRDVCLGDDYTTWWKDVEKPKRAKAANKKAREKRVRVKVKAKRIKVKVKAKRVGEWDHSDYLREQQELKKPNGWKCRECGEDLTGDNWMWCPEHYEPVKRHAAIERTDGNYGGGGDTGVRRSLGVM